jgi:hypothetical protein
MRYHFMKWKKNGEKMTVAVEMEEEGPIREKIFEEAIKLKNC